MEQSGKALTQTCTIQLQSNEFESVMEILRNYSDLYTERPENIYSYFDLMLKDQKPAVSIEIYDQPPERTRALKESLERHFFVFGDYKMDGKYSSFNLSVSKIRSVAKYVDIVEKEGFTQNAGVAGLLLGYKINEVIEYIKRRDEDGFKGGFKRSASEGGNP